MALWMVRAGKDGEHEDLALEQHRVLVGWPEVGSLEGVRDRDTLKARLREAYPDMAENGIVNWAGQLWAFLRRIQEGDLVALPLKAQPSIAFGRIVGGYEFRADYPEGAQQTRRVEWIRTDVPRGAFDKDILYSLGAFLTVCQIKRNNAEERVKAVLEGRVPVPSPVVSDDEDEATDASTSLHDLEAFARDLIRERIQKRFPPHRFEALVEALLQAEGYVTERTSKGADGGVDIVAGSGPMGFDEPRLAVQVKSGETPQGTPTINQLQGAMTNFNARQGLFVSWGGYTNAALALRRQLFFQVRLWDADDVIDAVLEHYDRLPEDIVTELPLKRIWTLVPDEGASE